MSKMSPGAKEFYKARIGNIQIVFLVIIFGLLYALQFLLDLTVLLSILAAFIGFVATTGLSLYLYVKGVYKSKKNSGYKMLATMATYLVEIIPEVDLIPGDVLDVIIMIILSRIEDREIAEGKAIEAARVAQEQQIQVARYAEYVERNRQQQEYEIEVENENAIAIANDNERKEEESVDDDEFDENFDYEEAA